MFNRNSMKRELLVCQNAKISAANYSVFVDVPRYASSHFIIFARNFGILIRH